VNEEGYVEKYPCSCFSTGICWVVRHKKVKPPISYSTEEEANKELEKARKS